MPTKPRTPLFSVYSVIKNVANRERMFRRSIESVLGQTFTDFEYVIQDGGSTDQTAQIIAEYADPRIQFLSVPDSCGEEGFFRVLKRCRGKYIGSCLSDEELFPDALESARRAFEDHPNIAAFYGNVSYVNEDGQKWGPRVPPHPFSLEAYVCQDLVPPFCSSFFRRQAIEKAGLHDHHWRYGIGEFEFWIRIAGVGEIIYLPLDVTYYGRHAQSNTRSVGIYDQLTVERERVMPDLFRENRVLRECHVTVEQAIAANYVWAARGVFNLEGGSAKCKYFMQQAARHDPDSPQLARLKTQLRGKNSTPSANEVPSSVVRTTPSTAPTQEFARWLKVLSAMDNRLYYRDQSPQTLAALWSLARDFDPTVIVELGTLGGLSLRTWLAATERARVVAIDLSFTKLAQTRRLLPADLSRVTLLEQDILKTDFASRWTAQDRVVLFVDAHDLPHVPIMEHVLAHALPALPDGSLVIVDDLWFSEQRLTHDSARAFLESRVVGEIDELQCFNGHYAPYHERGSFMGFAEVIPLLDFVNRYGVTLVYEQRGKHAHFTWSRDYLSRNRADLRESPAERNGWRGAVLYNPLESVPVSGPLRETMRCLAATYSQGKTKQVAEHLQQLLSQHPHDQGVGFAFAVCLAKLGLLSQARDVLAAGAMEPNPPRYQRLLDDLTARVEPPASPQPEDEDGLTIFALPKPFDGDIGTIQKNAIRSWARLRPRPEIILFGDEAGTRQMAEEVGAQHIRGIERNEFGTPLVDKLFQAAQDHASHSVVAYVNADMILFQDFVEAARRVRAELSDFLLIGQRWDLPLLDEIDFDRSDWQAALQRQMQEHAMIHPESGLDYFVFRKGLWPTIPPFALGRTVWDNWLVMDPNQRGIPVVDGTEYVTAVHQDHDYAHMTGGREEAWKGTEATRNRALAGKTDRSGRTSGATWILKSDGKLVKAEPRGSWCDTVVYKDQRSVWLLEHANRLLALDKHALAASKCEEALVLMHALLRRARRTRRPDNDQDHTLLAQRYVSCHMLLAQCCLKMGRYDRVTAVYTQLLENSLVHIPQSMRDDVTRLRDRFLRLSSLQPSVPPPVAERETETRPQHRHDGTPAGDASIRCHSSSGGARHVAPKVSVILACHDAQEFLPECLDSILAQTMSDWELHVLDDGSADGTRRIIADYAGRDERIIPYYFDDNAGPYVRRNRAIERAGAPFIVIQDADDLMCPNKLERLHRAITQDERLGVVGSFYRMFLDRYQGPDHTEDVILTTTHEQILEDYRNGGICDYAWHGSAIIRKRLFEDIGPYDENPFSSDSFWLAKVAEYASRSDELRLKNIPEFLTLRRMRADSQTGSLPSFDPRGRRARFREYRRSRLSEVIQKLDADPTVDVKAELRKSVCGDFIQRHEHLFKDWESQPLTARIVGQFMARIYSQFGTGQLVRCINTCGIVERLASGIAQTVRAYDLVRGLAYFALGLPDKSRLYLEREAQTHGTEVARAFCVRHLDRYDPQWTRADRIAMVRDALFGAEPFGRSAGAESAMLRCVADRRSRHATPLSIVVPCGVVPSGWSQQVAALNAQTDKGFEVIVLGRDPDSSDVSSLLQDADFDYVVLEAGEELSPWRQRNAAVAHARGSHVAFLGEWVVPEPEFVQRVVRRFEAEDINGLRGRILSDGAMPVCFDLGSETLCAACDADEMCVFPKDVFTLLGGFAETPFMRGAFQLSYRIYTGAEIPARPILYCPEVVARYIGPRQERERLVDRSSLENHFCIDYLKRAGLLQNGDIYLTMTFFGFVSGLYCLSDQADERHFEHLLDNCLFFGRRFPRVAVERAEAALAYRPDSLVARHIAASLYARLDQPGHACRLLEEALSPLEGLLALGRIDRARSEFTNYTDVCECYVGGCTLLAQCYLKVGRHDKVVAVYTRLLENPHVQVSESQRKDMERVRDRLLGMLDATLPVPRSVAPRDAMNRSATCEPPTETISRRPDEVPTASPPDRAEPLAVSEAADVHAEAVAKLEARYASMAGNAPAKHVTAVRLSEICRRAGRTDKASTFALHARKIKNLEAFTRARQHKPHECVHKPMIVEFNVIGRCTAGCIMCNYGPHGDVLDLNRFKYLADDLLPAAQKVLLIGGEVLLHPDFYQMSEYASRFGVHLEMTTNLCSLAGDRAEAVERFFGSVKVSLDAATKQTYESIRTHLSFDRLQENLERLAQIKRRRDGLRLQLAFVAMERNVAELPDTIEMVARFGFDSVAVSFVHVDGRLTLDDSLLFHRELANRCFDQARRKAQALGVRLEIPNNFDVSRKPYITPERPTEGHRQCLRPWQRIRVLLNGDIVPCCRLYRLRMGNALTEPFEQTWNGSKYQDLREAIATGSERMPAECKHCELITGPTDSNDALLHINLRHLADLRQRLAAAAIVPRTHVAVGTPGVGGAPKVTVVTACHNCECFLVESLESVRRQSLQDWELYLLDDASTDGTRPIIEEYVRRDARIKPFYFDTNAGPYVRRNFAIERAGSDFIVIHDSDDLMEATKLERLYDEISKDSRLAMVGSFYRTFFEEFKGIQYTDPIELPVEHEQIAKQAASWRHGISHISAIIRKSMFERIGGYDENPFASDAFWSAKLAELSRHDPSVRFKNIAEFLTLYRVHSVSQTQVLSTFDPRNRRIRYRSYGDCKLERIREEMRTVPGTDIERELRACNCSDFLTRFKAHIIKWENEPLDPRVLESLLQHAVGAFNAGGYVSCVNILNGVEMMEPALSKRIVGFDLLRGMAFYALDVRERSLASLEREIDHHDSPAARQFKADAFEHQGNLDVLAWCDENAGRYNLELNAAEEAAPLCVGAARK
ncbi:MAG: glycosyltransferase [Sedimentisphaerales bacterium]|nr:glycosyltransferase [Sedimentisphaerales bacterium]